MWPVAELEVKLGVAVEGTGVVGIDVGAPEGALEGVLDAGAPEGMPVGARDTVGIGVVGVDVVGGNVQ